MTPQETLLAHMGWSPPPKSWRRSEPTAAPLALPPADGRRKRGATRWTKDGKCRVCGRERNAQHIGCAALLNKVIERLGRDGRCVVCDQITVRYEDGLPLHQPCEPAFEAENPKVFQEAIRLCRS